MSLLVVGSVAFDAVETPRGKVDRMLGGAATRAAGLAGMGIAGGGMVEADRIYVVDPEHGTRLARAALGLFLHYSRSVPTRRTRLGGVRPQDLARSFFR